MNNFKVALHPESIISPSAVLLGNITIGKDSSVFPGVIMRGDCNTITIGERTNIQDGAIVHMDYENGVVVGDEVTVGHGAILHGCTIGNRTIVGMGATILDGANVGSNCLIGAGALVPKGVTIPDGSLVMGLPGKVEECFQIKNKPNALILPCAISSMLMIILRLVFLFLEKISPIIPTSFQAPKAPINLARYLNHTKAT